MSPATTRSSSRAAQEARMPSLRRLQVPTPKPVVRLRLNHKQRTSISNTPSLKAEFTHKRFSQYSPKKLGEGGLGKVYRMHEKDSHQPYAVKVVTKDYGEKEEDYADRVYNEFEIASLLRHPNLARTFRLRARRSCWCVIMEHCANGDLFRSVCKKHLTAMEKLCLFKQLLHGVEYMHGQGVAHRDIKVENLLLNDVGHLKIADFGLSTYGDPSYGSSALKRCRGGSTRLIMPPEAMAEDSFYDGRAFDVWSCAMTLLVMLDQEFGNWNRSVSRAKSYKQCAGNWYLHLESHYGTLPGENHRFGAVVFALPNVDLRHLLLNMLHPEPAKRLTISQALDHPYVRAIPCCCPAPNSRDQGPPAQHYHGPPRFLLPCSLKLRLKLNLPRIKISGRD